ncbi:DEAD/DEAH box helicase domain-containing protein [Myceligenerans xiligouense]|uniref:DEAD/DEAH box helicase domain-containing protein n=1 Tax=Myceligenerans xiligouense TaxID=253184 RepID=A0A3N4YUU4_9MICO|nr:DEAD/DEAH box helicase domain-containing protein [Myceligenerans xiligouense]
MPSAEHPLLSVLTAHGARAERLTHVRTLPGRAGEQADWPEWADREIVAGYRSLGADRPWVHQAEAADAAWRGRHVALATSTGSGKSLAFWLPVLSDIRSARGERGATASGDQPPPSSANIRRPTAIYLSPTKALAADQFHALRRVLDAAGARDVRVTTCDGDTPREERAWAQSHADVVLTNPDFLHFALLPNHRRWSRLLRGLRYVIVDEGHAYRGVFGAHVSHVLRRLSRLAEHYAAVPTFPGAVPSARRATAAATSSEDGDHVDERVPADGRDPRGTGGPPGAGAAGRVRFVVASATSAGPGAAAGRLIGAPADAVTVVDRDTSPAGRRTFALWQPPEIAGYGFTRSGAASEPDDAARTTAADDPWALDADPDHESPPPAARAPENPRRSATAEAADLLADLAAAGARTLAFTRSRRGAESVAQRARDHLRHAIVPTGPEAGTPPETPGAGEPPGADQPGASTLAHPSERIAAYRGGYLPEERRELERAVRTGEILGLATTNALELGVDISGLDAVLVAGWPGTRTSLWQQAGRAGRAGADGLVAFVAREDPLDTYLVHHPEAIFDAPLEATVFDPENPHVLAPHLCVAAQELPLRTADLARFGAPEHVRHILEVLVARGALRRRASGWYWTHAQSAAGLTDLRGSGGVPVRVVEAGSGRLLGTVDAPSADGQVHDGAVYVHQGVTYVVRHLDLTDHTAVVVRHDVDYGTWSREVMEVAIQGHGDAGADDGSRAEQQSGEDRPVVTRDWGPITWGIGPVEVTSQVVSFQRRRLPDLQAMGTEALDLPERTLGTTAVWWSVPDFVLRAAGVTPEETPGALHAAEHASIGMLPLLATCDRWDLGGVSTDLHADTGQATVFVYDAFPGGAGFAERGYELGATWLRATRDAIAGCPCSDGCPACVQSPKCGSYNSPLEKAAAVRLLGAVISHAPAPVASA